MTPLIRNIIKKVPGSRWIATKLGFVTPPVFETTPHGEAGVLKVGHREYVGGAWEEIGRLQFDYLVSRGLLPHHYFCDVACGSLRAGVHFIRYLEKGHYLGIEKERLLISEGIAKELGEELYDSKLPQLVVSSEFAFDEFPNHADFALAQSLFTHLPPSHIEKCFTNLRKWIAPRGVFYATFFETVEERDNPIVPHDHLGFHYTKRQMEKFGECCGWKAEYIGNWNHPRGSVIVKYTPSDSVSDL
jgi:SAM-dependent methyltransferase